MQNIDPDYLHIFFEKSIRNGLFTRIFGRRTLKCAEKIKEKGGYNYPLGRDGVRYAHLQTLIFLGSLCSSRKIKAYC